MRRPSQLVLEASVVASVLIMLTLGGSVVTTNNPPSFVNLQNPSQLQASSNLSALATYYNETLSEIGVRNFANASFLLTTFRFVNIPPSVNGTARSANADLMTVDVAAANATGLFTKAVTETQAQPHANVTSLVKLGCSMAMDANDSLADFQGPQTARFASETVPVADYSAGASVASAEVRALLATCNSLPEQGSAQGAALLISSPQKQVETGATIELIGNLTFRGSHVAGEEVLFYANGSYFGSLKTSSTGELSGSLQIPFIYSHSARVQASTDANSTSGVGGATSNTLVFTVLFNQTNIVVADPPSYLPGATFRVHGNLTTTGGTPLPDAPVTVTYLGDSVATTTDSAGTFRAQFTVPNDATDGTYYVYAQFTPRGVYGPSFNFTSIAVYHIRLSLALSTPGLSWAGFSTHVEGTATANGTGAPNAKITLDSPWGNSTATTDADGRFDVVFPVSPLEFAFSRNVTVTGVPSEPYVEGTTVVATLGLFNMLVVILPAAIIGVVGYEANSLGVFQNMRRPRQETALPAKLEVSPLEAVPSSDKGPEPLRLLGRALVLASRRFSISLGPSNTIREMLSLVKTKDDGAAFAMFSKVLLAAEDFLYAPSFDPSRTEGARKTLSELEVLWS